MSEQDAIMLMLTWGIVTGLVGYIIGVYVTVRAKE